MGEMRGIGRCGFPAHNEDSNGYSHTGCFDYCHMYTHSRRINRDAAGHKDPSPDDNRYGNSGYGIHINSHSDNGPDLYHFSYSDQYQG